MPTAAEFDRLSVVLVGTRNPLNIGAAARALSNFGFLHLRVVRPYDLAFREARSAVDAERLLSEARQFENVADAVADRSLIVGTTDGRQRNPMLPIRRLEQAAVAIREHVRSGGSVAVLFGSEKVGLSKQDLSQCQLLLRIPTQTEHPSMNLGQAVGIVLYELVRQTEPESSEGSVINDRPATAGERERLVSVLVSALSLSGYDQRGADSALEEKICRMVGHLHLTQSDVQEWLGPLRQILWKLENT